MTSSIRSITEAVVAWRQVMTAAAREQMSRECSGPTVSPEPSP